MYGIDSCRLADGQTDAALREWSRGDESAISGVDTDGGTVFSAFDEQSAILQVESHVLWLVCAEVGNARLHVENVKQSLVHVNLPIAISVVGIVERWVWLGAGMRQHIHDLFGGECGIGLQPQCDGTGDDGCGHRCAALRGVVVGLAVVVDLVCQFLAATFGDFDIAVKGRVDAHSRCCDIGFDALVEGRSLRREASDASRLLGGKLVQLGIGVSVDVGKGRFIARCAYCDESVEGTRPP